MDDKSMLRRLLMGYGAYDNEEHQERTDSSAAGNNYAGFTPGGLLHSYFFQQQEEKQLQQQHRVVADPMEKSNALYGRHQHDPASSAFAGGFGFLAGGRPAGMTHLSALPDMICSHGLYNRAPVIPRDKDTMFLQKMPTTELGGTNEWIGKMSGEGDMYAQSGILGPWSATSAGLIGNMALSSPADTAKKPKRKEEGKPKRPLSAYNIFFKEERTRILEDIEQQQRSSNEAKEGKEDIQEPRKRAAKKIGFENLAKLIGRRWQDVSSERSAYYKRMADKDMVRYRLEMEKFSEMKSAAGIIRSNVGKHNTYQVHNDRKCVHQVFNDRLQGGFVSGRPLLGQPHDDVPSPKRARMTELEDIFKS